MAKRKAQTQFATGNSGGNADPDPRKKQKQSRAMQGSLPNFKAGVPPPKAREKEQQQASPVRRSLQRLPPELLREIFDFLDEDDLAAVARTCRALFPHAAAVLWRYAPAHVLVACPATTEHCREVYAPAVYRLFVCDCEQVLAAQRGFCSSDYNLPPPPDARPTPATLGADPLLRWGVFPCARDLLYIFDLARKRGERVAARRCRRVARLEHALDHCAATLKSVCLRPNWATDHVCRSRRVLARAATEPAAGAAAAIRSVLCADCVEFSEDVMSVLMRRCPGLQALHTFENLSIVGMQRAFDAAPAAPVGTRAFSELRHLNITVSPPEVPLLVSFFNGSVTKFELRLSAPRRASQPPPSNMGSPLAALADMTCLQELSIDFYDCDARLTVADALAFRTLPLGLRKFTVEGNFLTAPDLTDADVVAVASRLPELVELGMWLTAPRLTPDLLPKVGEACRGLEKLQLPVRCEAGALERWQAGHPSTSAGVLFPRLTNVSVEIVGDLVVISCV